MNVFKKVAQEYGTNESEVKKEIAFAIRQTMKNSDPNAQMLLNTLFCNNLAPTPKEFVKTLAEHIKKNIEKI